MMNNISAHCDDHHQCTVSLYLKLSRGQRIKSSAQGQCSGGDFNHDDDDDDDIINIMMIKMTSPLNRPALLNVSAP